MTEQKILTANNAHQLNTILIKHINDGWEPVGGHQVITQNVQHRYSGRQHRDTQFSNKNSQSILRPKAE